MNESGMESTRAIPDGLTSKFGFITLTGSSKT